MSDDMINHPPHYRLGDHEVIEITEHLDFLSGNVVKYICREGRKRGTDPLDDLHKALWYLERKIRLYDGADANIRTSDCAPYSFIRDAKIVLKAAGVDTTYVTALAGMLFTRGGRLYYNTCVDPDNVGSHEYVEASVPWPGETELRLLRAQRDLKYLDEERAELADTTRRLAAQVEAENNKKESTDE